jgi:hypothetical protein
MNIECTREVVTLHTNWVTVSLTTQSVLRAVGNGSSVTGSNRPHLRDRWAGDRWIDRQMDRYTHTRAHTHTRALRMDMGR